MHDPFFYTREELDRMASEEIPPSDHRSAARLIAAIVGMAYSALIALLVASLAGVW